MPSHGTRRPQGTGAQLEGSIIWHAWFIENLLTEIDRQTSDSRVPAPGWIDLVRLVHKEIVGEVPTEPAQAAEGGELGGGGRRQRQGDGAGHRVGVGLATAMPSFCQAGTSPAKVVISVSSWAKLSGTATTV